MKLEYYFLPCTWHITGSLKQQGGVVRGYTFPHTFPYIICQALLTVQPVYSFLVLFPV